MLVYGEAEVDAITKMSFKALVVKLGEPILLSNQ